MFHARCWLRNSTESELLACARDLTGFRTRLIAKVYHSLYHSNNDNSFPKLVAAASLACVILALATSRVPMTRKSSSAREPTPEARAAPDDLLNHDKGKRRRDAPRTLD